ncbi:MAG: glyoxalase [Gammaproteobacteria bacterium]|nr:glyoxalase [Gammaproteobacteria bacterium]
MTTALPGFALSRHHHITLCTGDAQEDYDFHTKVLGLKIVKKTLLYDGAVPIYHLYYGNDMGTESSLVTSFPCRHTGAKAQRGSGQITYFSLSAPISSLSFWKARLEQHGIAVREDDRLGERCLDFKHPCGIDYTITGVADDTRAPHSTGPVPADLMLRGTHAICSSIRDLEAMDEFMQRGWGGTRVADDRNYVRYQLGAGGSGSYVDFVIEPSRKPGSWTLGEGAVHHMAFQVETHAEQNAIKAFLEGMGYTDTSDVKDRGYFDSIYVRTPGGSLFEATVSHKPSFTCDETAERLGQEVMVSPQFKDSREALVAQLGVLRD